MPAATELDLPKVTCFGTIEEIFDTVQHSARFKKRQFAVRVDIPGARHPDHLRFELIQEDVARLDSFAPGDQVHIEYTVRGRRYQHDNRWVYNTHLEVVRLRADLTQRH